MFPLWVAALVLAATAPVAWTADLPPRERLNDVTPFRLPNQITTLDGKTYPKIILDKVEPDGLLVLYSPVEGGSGTAKLKFRNLPVELRERYGYDPDRAGNHEAAQVRGEAAWRAEQAVWMERREAAQAERAALDRQIRAEAELRIAEAERARAEAARSEQEQPVAFYPWWSSGCYASYHKGGRRFKHHGPRPQPVSRLTSVPSSPVFAPMRPSGK